MRRQGGRPRGTLGVVGDRMGLGGADRAGAFWGRADRGVVAEEAGAEEAARIGVAGGDAATGDGAAAAYRRARPGPAQHILGP